MITKSRNLQKTLGNKQVGSNICPQQHPFNVWGCLKSQVTFFWHGFSSVSLFSCFLKSWKHVEHILSHKKYFLRYRESNCFILPVVILSPASFTLGFYLYSTIINETLSCLCEAINLIFLSSLEAGLCVWKSCVWKIWASLEHSLVSEIPI